MMRRGRTEGAGTRILPLVSFGIVLAGCTAVRFDQKTSLQSKDRLFDLSKYESVQTRPGQDPDLVVVVAISGGGYRAANFGLNALLGLANVRFNDSQGRPTNLLDEVDYITTVSGGGLPGAILTKYQLTQGREATTGHPRISFAEYIEQEDIDKKLRQNLEKHLASSLLRWDVLSTSVTRGDRIQAHVDEMFLHWPESHQTHRCRTADADQPSGTPISLGDVFPAKSQLVRKACAPFWIANSTVYNNGRTLSFVPDALESLGVSGYWHRRKVSRLESPERFYSDIPLALGLRSSFNFPVVFPATAVSLTDSTIVADSEAHTAYLLDGGLADNLGLYSAVEAIRQEYERRVPHQKRLLLVIDAFNGSSNPEGKVAPPKVPEVIADSLLYLGLAASRTRAFLDLNSDNPGNFSLVEAASREADIAVAYLSLDRESAEARMVGTRFRLEEKEQEALAAAGRRQVCSVLGGTECVDPEPKGITFFARAAVEARRRVLNEEVRHLISEMARSATELRDDYDELIRLGKLKKYQKIVKRLNESVSKAAEVKAEDIEQVVLSLDIVVERIGAERVRLTNLRTEREESDAAFIDELLQGLNRAALHLSVARRTLDGARGKTQSENLKFNYSKSIRAAIDEMEALDTSQENANYVYLLDEVRTNVGISDLAECYSFSDEAVGRVQRAAGEQGERVAEAAKLLRQRPSHVRGLIGDLVEKRLPELESTAVDLGKRVVPSDPGALQAECRVIKDELWPDASSIARQLERLEEFFESDLKSNENGISKEHKAKLGRLVEKRGSELRALGASLVLAAYSEYYFWPDVLKRKRITIAEWASRDTYPSNRACPDLPGA